MLVLTIVPRYGVHGAAVASLLSMATVPPLIWFVGRYVLALATHQWWRLGRRFAVPIAVECGVCLPLRPVAADLPVLLVLLAVTVAIFPLACFTTGFLGGYERGLTATFLRPRRQAAA